MFAKLKSSGLALTSIVLTVILIAAGTTYAWFTATSAPTTGTVELGEMAIESAFVADTGDFLYEPGITIDVEGAVKNTGTLPFMAKLTLDSTTTLVREPDGTPLPAGTTRTISPDDNVQIEFDADGLASKIYDGGSVHIWMKDLANPGDYYLIVDPGVEVDVNFSALLDGEMGNEYMNATVSFDSSWFATQPLDGAVKSAWGIDWDEDLEMIPVSTGRARMAGDPNAYLAEYLEKLFDR
jgi:hypothetical protein